MLWWLPTVSDINGPIWAHGVWYIANRPAIRSEINFVFPQSLFLWVRLVLLFFNQKLLEYLRFYSSRLKVKKLSCYTYYIFVYFVNHELLGNFHSQAPEASLKFFSTYGIRFNESTISKWHVKIYSYSYFYFVDNKL